MTPTSSADDHLQLADVDGPPDERYPGKRRPGVSVPIDPKRDGRLSDPVNARDSCSVLSLSLPVTVGKTAGEPGVRGCGGVMGPVCSRYRRQCAGIQSMFEDCRLLRFVV